MSLEWGQPDYGQGVALAALLLLLGLVITLPVPFAANAELRPARHLLVKEARHHGRTRKRDRFKAWWTSTAPPLVLAPPPAPPPWSVAFHFVHRHWRTLRAQDSLPPPPPPPPPPSSHWTIEHRGAFAEVFRAIAAVLLIRRCIGLFPAAMRSVRRWHPAAMGGAISLNFAPDGAILVSWVQIGNSPEDRWRKLALRLQQRRTTSRQQAQLSSQAALLRRALPTAVSPQPEDRSSPLQHRERYFGDASRRQATSPPQPGGGSSPLQSPLVRQRRRGYGDVDARQREAASPSPSPPHYRHLPPPGGINTACTSNGRDAVHCVGHGRDAVHGSALRARLGFAHPATCSSGYVKDAAPMLGSAGLSALPRAGSPQPNGNIKRPQLEERCSPFRQRRRCVGDGSCSDQATTCAPAYVGDATPLQGRADAAPPHAGFPLGRAGEAAPALRQRWARPGDIPPGTRPPPLIPATASPSPDYFLAPPGAPASASAPPGALPTAFDSPTSYRSTITSDPPPPPHLCRFPPAHLERFFLRLERVSAQAVACDAASAAAAAATGDPPFLSVMLEAVSPPLGSSPLLASQLFACSSPAVGAGLLSLGISYEAFSTVAARLRLASNGGAPGGAPHPPLERWMVFIPRRLYSSRNREVLAFVLSVVVPTASLAWAAWALYANVAIIDRAVAWIRDAAIAAATAFVGERLVPLIRLTRYLLALLDAALRAASEEFYARLRPALVVAMPLLRQLGGIARLLAPAGQAAAEAAYQAASALRRATPPVRAAWAACRSGASALFSAGRAVTQGLATAISAVARASVGVSFDMPRRCVTWLLQLARFQEMPAAAQARNVLKTAALQAHKLTSPNARQAMKERMHTFTPTFTAAQVARKPPSDGPSRGDRAARDHRSASTPPARKAPVGYRAGAAPE